MATQVRTEQHPLQALIEKMRARLAPEAFARFKQQTAEFLHGQLTPAELHVSAVRLELAALAPELAALCPDAQRRAGLLQAHSDTFAEGRSTEVRLGVGVCGTLVACHPSLRSGRCCILAVCLRVRTPLWRCTAPRGPVRGCGSSCATYFAWCSLRTPPDLHMLCVKLGQGVARVCKGGTTSW